MSMDLLLDAARDHVRSSLSLAPAECDRCPDGQPNPGSGERFVAISPGDIENSQINCLDERYSFDITVTVRTDAPPRDRKADGKVWVLAEQVRAKVHMSYDLTARVTQANADVKFVEPPVFLGATYLGPQGPSWFWAEGQQDDASGIAVRLRFGRARRVQYIDDQT